MGRVTSLDGIRGIAALIVVMEHYLLAFYPLAMTDTLPWGGWDRGWPVLAHWSYSPLNLTHNGSAAVSVFFVLSGYVLARRWLTAPLPLKELPGRLLGRYVRLGLPVAAAMVVVWAGWQIGYGYGALTHQMAGLTPDYYGGETLSLTGAIRWGGVEALVWGGYQYNLPLWTMQIELFGSFLVLILVALGGGGRVHRYLWIGLLSVGVFLASGTHYDAFLLGVLVAELDRRHRWSQRKVATGLAILLGLGLLSFTKKGGPDGLYGPLLLHGGDSPEALFHAWGAAMLVAGVIFGRWGNGWLAAATPQRLGRLSFSIYILHFPVLGVVGTAIYFGVAEYVGHGVAVFSSMLVGVVTTIVLSVVFARWVDRPAIAASRWCYRIGRKFGGHVSAKPA